MPRPAIPYDYTCLQTVLQLNKKYSEKTNQTNISHLNGVPSAKHLLSMFNHMVGRAASFVFPFYSILLGVNPLSSKYFVHYCTRSS